MNWAYRWEKKFCMGLCEVRPMKVAIFTEDKYAPPFLKELIHKLEKEGFINKIEFVRKYTPSLIEKCHNVGSKVRAIVREVNRVIIVIDKENPNYDEDKEIWRHLKNLKSKDKRKIVVISTEPEIEEWICVSKGMGFDSTGINKNKKPSRILKEKINYKKSDLPKFAEDIDVKKLLKCSESFKKFVQSLT